MPLRVIQPTPAVVRRIQSLPTGVPVPSEESSKLSSSGVEHRPSSPNFDLENGSQRSMTTHHWWSLRRRRGPRQLPPNTASAHCKPQIQLFKEIIFSSWANILLICVPLGIGLHFADVSPKIVFVINVLVIVPLSGVTDICGVVLAC